MTTETVAFEVESFTWDAGAFVLTGHWSGDADGRVRLLVDVDGRRRNIGAQGGKTAAGEDWRATFVCTAEPDPGTAAAVKVGGAEIPLPPPDLAPAPEEAGRRTLLEQIRIERAALERTRQALARERKALEEARREPARRPAGQPEVYTVLGYVVGGAIAFLFLLVLIWLL